MIRIECTVPANSGWTSKGGRGNEGERQTVINCSGKEKQGEVRQRGMLYAVLSHFSRVQLFVTPWTVAYQASPSMGFSRQEYCSGLPCPSPRDLPKPGIEPTSLTSTALACGFFTTNTPWEPGWCFLGHLSQLVQSLSCV